MRISLLAVIIIGLIIDHISGNSKRPINYPDEGHLLLVETKTGIAWIKGGAPTTSSINSYIFGLVFVAVGVSLIWIAAVVVTSIYKLVLYRYATAGECPDEFRGIDLDRAFIMIDEVRTERKARRAERKRIRSGQKQNMPLGPPHISSPDENHKAEAD